MRQFHVSSGLDSAERYLSLLLIGRDLYSAHAGIRFPSCKANYCNQEHFQPVPEVGLKILERGLFECHHVSVESRSLCFLFFVFDVQHGIVHASQVFHETVKFYFQL